MHTTRKLKRLRKRYLALILSFSAAYPSFVEAGWTRGRRSKQLICSVALLGAAVSTMPWWSETPPPNTPAWPGIGQLQADGRSMQESGLGVLMTFSAGAEETHVRVFEEGWLERGRIVDCSPVGIRQQRFEPH